MSALRLASTDDLDRLVSLVERYHAHEGGIEQDDETRRAALYPLLEGSPPMGGRSGWSVRVRPPRLAISLSPSAGRLNWVGWTHR